MSNFLKFLAQSLEQLDSHRPKPFLSRRKIEQLNITRDHTRFSFFRKIEDDPNSPFRLAGFRGKLFLSQSDQAGKPVSSERKAELSRIGGGSFTQAPVAPNEVIEDPPPGERERKRERVEATMRGLIDVDCKNESVVDLIKKIKNGFKHWFTAVTEPGVELTNNRAERALREHVVLRKIIGTLRNEKGMRIHETIMTMLATWKQNGRDPYDEMHKAIRS